MQISFQKHKNFACGASSQQAQVNLLTKINKQMWAKVLPSRGPPLELQISGKEEGRDAEHHLMYARPKVQRSVLVINYSHELF